MKHKGFTLVELVVVIVLLGILAVTVLPRFLDLRDDANQAAMLSMKGALSSAERLIAQKILLNPDGLNTNQNRFTLDSGQTIRVRGKLADGRWNNTFAHLVNFTDIAQVSSNNCNDAALKWCVRQRAANWFISRSYSTLGADPGRGFIIFPYGKNVNQDRCYVYYLNQNSTAIPTTVYPSIIDVDFSGC